MGNRDPRPGRSPGYDEQQPPDATAAQKPGGKRAPDAEAGGVERNVESEPGAETT